MSKHTSLILGVGFTFLGFMGYLSSQVEGSEKSQLLGLFTNSHPQTVLYVMTGLGMLWCLKSAKKYYGAAVKAMAVVYGLLTVVSVVEKSTVLGVFSVNMHDSLLYFVVATLATAHVLSDGKDA